MGYSNVRKFKTRIFPFRDRPDLSVEVVFFKVPDDRECLPYPHVFGDRTYDEITQVRCHGGARQGFIGTAYPSEDWEYYKGPVPEVPLGPMQGTEDDWINGTLHSVYIAGGYPSVGPCINVRSIVAGNATHSRTEPPWRIFTPVAGGASAHTNVYGTEQTGPVSSPAFAIHSTSEADQGAVYAPGKTTHAGLDLVPGLIEAPGKAEHTGEDS